MKPAGEAKILELERAGKLPTVAVRRLSAREVLELCATPHPKRISDCLELVDRQAIGICERHVSLFLADLQAPERLRLRIGRLIWTASLVPLDSRLGIAQELEARSGGRLKLFGAHACGLASLAVVTGLLS